jgi:uncharacterized membrane protein YiaA
MPTIPYWLDPSVQGTASVVLAQASARRTSRRQNGDQDFVEQAESQFLNPADLMLLKQDIGAYNAALASQPIQSHTGMLAIAGALILFGFVLTRK